MLTMKVIFKFGTLFDSALFDMVLSTRPSTEKLYYLLSDMLAQIKQNTEVYRKISLSSKQWANILSCSKNHILTMQKKTRK